MNKIKSVIISRSALIFSIPFCTQIMTVQAQINTKVERSEKQVAVDKALQDDSVLIDGYAKLILAKNSSTDNEIQYVIKAQGLKPLGLRKSVYESSGKRTLAEYFSDDIELSKKILKGVFKFEDIKKIVEEYNSWRRSIDRMTNEVK